MPDDPIARLLEAIVSATVGGCDSYSPDAQLDATVPGWRFRVVGETAIKAEYAKWFAHPATFVGIERLPVADGEVVIYEMEWSEDGVRHRAHHAHRFAVANGQIIADTVWCGGRWSEPRLQKMGLA
jgi:hypothetical protein